MKSIVIYYSYSGNTKKVAETLRGYLNQKGDAHIIELKALDESNSFLGQCRRAVSHKKGQIADVNLDFSAYDLICIGTPVWAFGPAPAVNTCLDKCSGINGKEVILFTTYGSGTGNAHCLNYMEEVLTKKGAGSFRRFSIQQFKVKDEGFVFSKIKQIARL